MPAPHEMMAELDDPRCYKNFGCHFTLSDALVKITVANQDSFHVRRDVLSGVGFFDGPLKKYWPEGQQGTVSLPEEDPKVFTIYLQNLYHKVLFVKKRRQPKSAEYVLLARLYALGEKMIDGASQNRVMDAFLASALENTADNSTFWPTKESVEIIYNATPKDLPGRKLMVAMHVYAGGPHWLPTDPDACNHEFTKDLSRALLEYRTRPNQTRGSHLKTFLKQDIWSRHVVVRKESDAAADGKSGGEMDGKTGATTGKLDANASTWKPNTHLAGW